MGFIKKWKGEKGGGSDSRGEWNWLFFFFGRREVKACMIVEHRTE